MTAGPYSDVIITDTVFDILGTARTIAARMLVAFVVCICWRSLCTNYAQSPWF
ncbi:hypothetical protein O9993_12450 [Vibrio lentus]|nr:hypothetical protein [Vibrio lentus]